MCARFVYAHCNLKNSEHKFAGLNKSIAPVTRAKLLKDVCCFYTIMFVGQWTISVVKYVNMI